MRFPSPLSVSLSGASNFPNAGLYVLFMINDNAPWFGWWGVVAAAGLCAWLAFRLKLLPIWLGLLSAVAVAIPVVIMALTGAVAVVGAVGPIWLTVASLTVASRGRPMPVQAPATASVSPQSV